MIFKFTNISHYVSTRIMSAQDLKIWTLFEKDGISCHLNS